MEFISKEMLNKYFEDKSNVCLNDLTQIIEEQFGVIVKIEENNEVAKITKRLSENGELIDKIKRAREKRESGFPSYIRNKTDFLKLANETSDDVK
ncbi:hypothetical protein [Oceanobacillus sp. Castelsardo]|uniref:hypothetical protein n=1 Tax=Oceanobacillus sp. Castelsardo TaxID=1851204 RepID=UPI000837CB1A|nr:hypothetical protein [Oceanobacillus sp. Castelsardo]